MPWHPWHPQGQHPWQRQHTTDVAATVVALPAKNWPWNWTEHSYSKDLWNIWPVLISERNSNFRSLCQQQPNLYQRGTVFFVCNRRAITDWKTQPSIHCKHRVGSHHLCRTHKKWAPTPYTVHSCLLELPPPACTLYRCAMHFPHTFQISSHNIDGNHQFNPLQNILHADLLIYYKEYDVVHK